ncbi:hypothetical protein M8J76_003255 [Diaphorina citri]|nr:hypothetical protein M8J76_003255 [Diaphorina citri]
MMYFWNFWPTNGGLLILLLVNCVNNIQEAFGGIVIHDEADKYSEYFKYKAQAEISENEPNYWQQVGLHELKFKLNKPLIKGEAKNVIMFLGDGMSLPTITAARIYKGQLGERGPDEPRGEQDHLSFENFPFTGMAKTYCVDQQTADSACTATAYLCGVKNNFGTIGVNSKISRKNCEGMKNPEYFTTSILKWAQDFGKSTGIVTTTRVTHASPAGTYAHTAERDWECDADIKKDPERIGNGCKDIAYQLVKDDPGRRIKVIMGGGRAKFLPVSSKDDEGNVGESPSLLLVHKTRPGLFASDHLHYNLGAPASQPTLAEMTRTAIRLLEKEKKGYFLFVEGGHIDTAHHNNTPRYALDETVELAKAVSVAVNLTSEKDTLIVVTADHAHTMMISGYSKRNNDILGAADQKDLNGNPYPTLSYANGPAARAPVYNATSSTWDASFHYPALVPAKDETHGGDDVMVYARGPWSHLFTGSYEQNFIPIAMGFASRVGPNSKLAGASGGVSTHETHAVLVLLSVAVVYLTQRR